MIILHITPLQVHPNFKNTIRNEQCGTSNNEVLIRLFGAV